MTCGETRPSERVTGGPVHAGAGSGPAPLRRLADEELVDPPPVQIDDLDGPALKVQSLPDLRGYPSAASVRFCSDVLREGAQAASRE